MCPDAFQLGCVGVGERLARAQNRWGGTITGCCLETQPRVNNHSVADHTILLNGTGDAKLCVWAWNQADIL